MPLKLQHYRFVILRTKPSVSGMGAEKMAAVIDSAMKQRAVHIVLKQRIEDPSDVILHCVRANRLEMCLRKLSDEGYDLGKSKNQLLIHLS